MRDCMNRIDAAAAFAGAAPPLAKSVERHPDCGQLLSQILEGNPVPTFIIDADHVVIHWNKACERISGFIAADMVGTRDQWRPFYGCERPLMADLIVDQETEECFSRYYGGKLRRSPLIEGVFEAEDYFESCGGCGRWLVFTAAPLRNEHGHIIGAIETLQDTTERKRAEFTLRDANADLTALNTRLAEVQQQLLQSDKLASIGLLAAGVAHEINNPIGFVQSNIGTLERYLNDIFRVVDAYGAAEPALGTDAARLAEIERIKREVDLDFLRHDVAMLVAESSDGISRVRKIVQDLKDFSRIDNTQEWQLADVHQGLDSTLNVVNNEIKYKADVVKEYGDLPEIECLPSQLNQVFLNLLVNAADAMGAATRGRITLRSGCDGDQAWIEVADSGSGIAPGNLGRIFDPFFTTKPVGKGTGLGLSLAYGIVKKHGGRIDVHSELARGTTFRVVLPLRQAAGH